MAREQKLSKEQHERKYTNLVCDKTNATKNITKSISSIKGVLEEIVRKTVDFLRKIDAT